MAEETHLAETRITSKKRKLRKKKGKKAKKKMKIVQGSGKKVKIDPKMKNIFRKRAQEYNSDDEDEEHDKDDRARDEDANNRRVSFDESMLLQENEDGHSADASEDGVSDEDGDIQPGVTKFTEGCRAFKMAFKSIMKKAISSDSLGPVLSAHKKLVVEKLAEEEAERKSKGEAKKEKHLVAEKGHVKPLNYLDSHDKFLIGVATKGVVKLFNAVNKAQSAQKGLNPSRSKDAKVIRKRRKAAFFSELGKTSSTASSASAKDHSSNKTADEGPAWAPLRDNYMLASAKLKDWDKKEEPIVEDDIGRMSESSDTDSD